MLFNSYHFILVFLPMAVLVYFGLTRLGLVKAATWSMALLSLVFYGYWDIRCLPVLISSFIFNFIIGKQIEKSRSLGILTFAVAVNLVTLGFFKYTTFLFKSINTLAADLLPVPEIALPLGISFFTFTQIAYLVDAFRGETKHYRLREYSVFVTFFPHLIAGPILYHKKIIPQFLSLRNHLFSKKNFSYGLTLFSMGLFKKIVIADRFIYMVQPVFENAAKATFSEAWIGALAYSLQLYFDFSAYSEMAMGLGWMFNIELPKNFDSPYKSRSVIEFWKRWHMTLSEFLKNYLYIPLGGNRKGEARRYLNLFITMFLGGIWHGAGWTFVVWGLLHGAFLIINHLWRKVTSKTPAILSWPITVACVVVAWVFFRAATVTDAWMIVKTMFGAKGVSVPSWVIESAPVLTRLGIGSESYSAFSRTLHIHYVVFMLLMLAISLFGPNVFDLMKYHKRNVLWALITASLLGFCLLNMTRVTEFLYFQF